MAILAIDFDGVLMNPADVKLGYTMGEPVDGAVEGMQTLHRAGHQLIVHTVRGDRPHHVQDWLKWFKIPFSEVTRLKPEADIYLDDHAVRFQSWAQFNVSDYGA